MSRAVPQTRRVLDALRTARSQGRGITRNDFEAPNGRPVIDGGPRILRLARCIGDLRDQGHTITSRPGPEGVQIYTLQHEVVAPVAVEIEHGWTRTHFCRRCDFPGERPCGPVCPTCGGDAIATVSLDARPQQNARRAA